MCKSSTYKGFIIYENENGSNFPHPYFSIVNPKLNKPDGKKVHVHVCPSQKTAKLVIDCGLDILNTGFTSRTKNMKIRNKALKLIGVNIRSR